MPTGIYERKGLALWTKLPRNTTLNPLEKKELETPVPAGSRLCLGPTTSRSPSNIRLHPDKPISCGHDTFTAGTRTRVSAGLYVAKEETWVDGSIYTVLPCSATRYTPKALTDGGDPIMESRTYGLFAMAEALGSIVVNTSQKRGQNGI